MKSLEILVLARLGTFSIGGRLFGFTHQTVNSGSVLMIDGQIVVRELSSSTFLMFMALRVAPSVKTVVPSTWEVAYACDH